MASRKQLPQALGNEPLMRRLIRRTLTDVENFARYSQFCRSLEKAAGYTTTHRSIDDRQRCSDWAIDMVSAGLDLLVAGYPQIWQRATSACSPPINNSEGSHVYPESRRVERRSV